MNSSINVKSTNKGEDESLRIKSTLSLGLAGSIGRNAAPDFNMEIMEITYHWLLGNMIPTRTSALSVAFCCKKRENWLERRSNSEKVYASFSKTSAVRLGVLLTCMVKRLSKSSGPSNVMCVWFKPCNNKSISSSGSAGKQDSFIV